MCECTWIARIIINKEKKGIFIKSMELECNTFHTINQEKFIIDNIKPIRWKKIFFLVHQNQGKLIMGMPRCIHYKNVALRTTISLIFHHFIYASRQN